MVRTRRVMAMAKTPSLNASTRLLLIPGCFNPPAAPSSDRRVEDHRLQPCRPRRVSTSCLAAVAEVDDAVVVRLAGGQREAPVVVAIAEQPGTSAARERIH